MMSLMGTASSSVDFTRFLPIRLSMVMVILATIIDFSPAIGPIAQNQHCLAHVGQWIAAQNLLEHAQQRAAGQIEGTTIFAADQAQGLRLSERRR